MKHSLTMTLILIGVFLTAQIVGLFVINNYIDHMATTATGEVTYKVLPFGMERPDLPQSTSYIWIFFAILFGTGLLMLLMRFGAFWLLRLWFIMAIVLCLAIALAAFVPQSVALLIAAVAGYMRIFRKNILVHNITEILLYGGLAAIFVPLMNLFSAAMMLVLISVYDMIAVWGSKHMVKLAQFQTKADLFAGVFIPYDLKSAMSSRKAMPKTKGSSSAMKGFSEESKNVILGGGDIGFPLIFAGVVMKGLMLTNVTWIGFLKTLVMPLATSAALLWLLMLAKKDRFYPAMPFISIGCLVGWLITLAL